MIPDQPVLPVLAGVERPNRLARAPRRRLRDEGLRAAGGWDAGIEVVIRATRASLA
jgi:hypothetical protein